MTDAPNSAPEPTIPPHAALVEFWRAQQDPEIPPHGLLSDFWRYNRVGFHIVGPGIGGPATVLYANEADLAHGHVGESIAVVHTSEATIADILGRLTRGEAIENYRAKLWRPDRSIATVSITSIGRFEDGALRNTRCVTCDVTEEEARAEEKRRLLDQLQRQAEAIQQMEVPIVRVAPGVLLATIVGILDSQRASLLTDRLLARIQVDGARCAILDLTEIFIVDTEVADHLLRTARMAGLLGSRVVLTGLRGAVAQALVGLGVDMSSLVTLGTVEAGLVWCRRRMA